MILIGEAFGLDGVVAAKADRFAPQALKLIGQTHAKAVKAALKRAKKKPSNNAQLVTLLTDSLREDLDIREWMQTLLADINNQQEDAERMIDRSCIFKWATTNMGDPGTVNDINKTWGRGVTKHDIFYQEDRDYEYLELKPNEPLDENKYEPFLSPVVLASMLRSADFLLEITPEDFETKASERIDEIDERVQEIESTAGWQKDASLKAEKKMLEDEAKTLQDYDGDEPDSA